MIMTIYKRALEVVMKKPLKLWGVILLGILLNGVGSSLFGVIPGVALGISLLFSVSLTIIFLRGYRGEEVNCMQLFACFKDWATAKRVLCGMGWMALWIYIWGLIPVVGPIFAMIRTYEYRLTPYILVTEPDVAPTEAIKLSKERTYGYKAKMFLAEFLVGVIIGVAFILLALLSSIPYIGFLFVLVTFALYVAVVALMPLFMGLVQAAFYEEITNPTIVTVVPGSTYCGQCGAPVAPGAAFCGKCGAKQ